jgi:hypothetical protein
LDIVDKWTETLIEVANRDEFNSDNFTINIQPFSRHVKIPLTESGSDFSYMSFDCFHLSQKAYALATNALWNNMLTKDGNKSETWDVENAYKFLCPTNDFPYLATRENSRT